MGLTLLANCTACSPSSPPQSEAVSVTFVHGRLSGDPSVFEGILRDFERQHPGVVVREETLPASSDQQHQYYAMTLEGRQVPFDLFGADTIWIQEFAQAGWIAPLDHLVPTDAREQFFPGPIEAATVAAHLYAVPWYIDAGVLYYRRDLLERYGLSPPLTWLELVRTATRLLEAEHDPRLLGFLWQGKQYEGLVCVALEVVRSNGSDLWDGDDGRAEEALRFLRDVIVLHRVTPLFVSTADEETTRRLFGGGRAIFMRNWPYAWSLLQGPESPVRGTVGVAPLPAFPGHPSVPTLGGWMLAVPRRAPHPKEAAQLLTYLTSPVVQRRMALAIGYNPTRQGLYRDAALLAVRPLLKDLYPVFLDARPRPITPYYLMLSQALQPELSAVVVGTKTPRAALADARRQAARMLGSKVDRTTAPAS